MIALLSSKLSKLVTVNHSSSESVKNTQLSQRELAMWWRTAIRPSHGTLALCKSSTGNTRRTRMRLSFKMNKPRKIFSTKLKKMSRLLLIPLVTSAKAVIHSVTLAIMVTRPLPLTHLRLQQLMKLPLKKRKLWKMMQLHVLRVAQSHSHTSQTLKSRLSQASADTSSRSSTTTKRLRLRSKCFATAD